MKLTPDEVKKLSFSGREGLLREMIEVHDWRFVTGHDIKKRNKSRDGGVTNRYLKELYEEGMVERESVRSPDWKYRPDAVARDLSIAVNAFTDLRAFIREARTRFRITCPGCGYSVKVLPRQLLTRVLPCSRCGYFPRTSEYPPLMDNPR
uniref:Uncharacterized protein n=1 Tax=viral metagenome TaxID=1070528 RepID=A0A6M3LWB2_9ZZZZ